MVIGHGFDSLSSQNHSLGLRKSQESLEKNVMHFLAQRARFYLLKYAVCQEVSGQEFLALYRRNQAQVYFAWNLHNHWNSEICHSFPRLFPFLTARPTVRSVLPIWSSTCFTRKRLRSPSVRRDLGTVNTSPSATTAEAAWQYGSIQTHGERGWMQSPS